MEPGAHEGVHPPGPQELWAESWYFDFAARDASAGGFVRVGSYPALGVTSWWAYVVVGSVVAGVRLDRPTSAERGAPFHLSDPELSADLTPTGGPEQWRLSARAGGFALDVGWRAVAASHGYRRGSRYEQAGWTGGSVTAGGVTVPVDGPGQRDHSWGVRDWWRFGWTWCAGWLPGDERFQATSLEARGRIDPDGYVLTADGGLRPVRHVTVEAGGVRLDGRAYRFDDVASATVHLVAPDGRESRLVRSMTLVRGPDGRRGVGWRERNTPEPRSTVELPRSLAL
jgi:hypothetical protein